MGFTINTNIASLQAQAYLRANNTFQNKTIQEVTSGLRIVNSGDDAAGLAIANGDRSNEAVLTQGIQNANDGLSQLQTIDGGINNISQLLDRARTLATQSASGTFNGDRSVLNSEFQSVVGEIDRQAQAIGLNAGGIFAKNLAVFIGGGQTSNGISAIQNGSVSVDLSKSMVDAKSLGLEGVQAMGVAGTDIGPGSAATSLSQILANTTNTGSEGTPGFTRFIFKGPGFDGIGVNVSVNTANLADTSSLVAAINAAIRAAGAGGTQQGTALANANITASINTDATGKQQLVFQSSNAAFQVVAGDKVSNALLGNFAQNAIATSSDTNPYLNTSVNNTLTFSIDGGASFNVNVTTGAATSKGQIVADLNANATFRSQATAYLSGNQVVVKSKNTGSTSLVAVTGNLATPLGFTGTATAAAASTGADLSTSVQGANAVAANVNLLGTDTGATATIGAGANALQLTVGSTTATLTLTQGTNLTKAAIAADINTQIAGGGLAGLVSASVVNNQIVLTAANPGNSITVGAATTNATLGFAVGANSSVHSALSSDNITLQFIGAGLSSPVNVSLSPTAFNSTTSAQVLADLQTKIANNSQLEAAGISLTTSALGDNLVFTDGKGQQFQVLASGDSTNLLGLGSFQAGNTNSAVEYSSIFAPSAYSRSARSGTATLEFSLNGNASSANAASANLQSGDATSAAQTGTITYTGANSGLVDLSGATGSDKLAVSIDGTTYTTAALGASATTSVTAILSAINTAIAGHGTATLNASNSLVITSSSFGSSSNVTIGAVGATGSDAAVLAALGLTAGNSVSGQNASETNVIQQLNQSISSNATLVAAGLQAVDHSGAIEIQSTNGTYFRLNATGNGFLGFSNSGASFTGNAQSAAPASSPYFDSQGANASSTLAYTPTLFGSDSQNISITANDPAGGKHALSVAINNNGTSSIDQTLAAINAALQQSNDSTLNQIVAVKEDTGNGAQSIRFLSTVNSFQVTVNSNPNGTGITPPTGNVTTAQIVGTGSTADIGSQTNAEAAVTALAVSVTLLGNAQAVVGRGENQFNYAINLAQSQLTNTTAAESRIRDADLAAAAANLTKAQILVQAGVAALAQANSAPQQVLTLLKG